MQNHTTPHHTTKLFLAAFLIAATTLLAGCGDGVTANATTPGTPTTTTPGTTTTALPTLTVALFSGATQVTSITGVTTARATVRDAAGVAVPGVVVTFSPGTLVTMNPTSGTALTDVAGVASVTLNPGSTSGAAALTATSSVGSTAVSGSVGYSVGAPVVTLSTISFGIAPPLSALGSTSVSVTVSSGGAPVATQQTVNFSSTCASATPTKATITASATTVAGVATASYVDKGCASTDTITASIGGVTASATLVVNAPTAGSIKFVSATPSNLALKGTGGTENAQVVFEVLDTGGNPIGGKSVTFVLSTSVGGITLNPSGTTTATSDNAGRVSATVGSGTINTAVRITATTPGAGTTILSTQSSGLTISTGIPDQDSFTLGPAKLVLDGEVSGTTTQVTARLADHFNNPVPDNTAVNFTTEGGAIQGSCFTSAGACSVTLTVQDPRPSDGRATILAYAVGEESFTDLDGDGLADGAEPFTDMAEAFLDKDEDEARDVASPFEPFIDFNSNGTLDAADTKYNGVLCNETAGSTPAGYCSPNRTIHVRQSTVVVFSKSSNPVVSLFLVNPDESLSPITPPLDLGCNLSQAIRVGVSDVNSNPLPEGTTIAVSTSNGTLDPTAPSFTTGNSTSVELYPFSITGDGTGAPCADSVLTGNLTVKITVLGKPAVSRQIPVVN